MASLPRLLLLVEGPVLKFTLPVFKKPGTPPGLGVATGTGVGVVITPVEAMICT